MSDLASLVQSILAQITAAGDEAALEAVRVASLGKKGSISALLATLGKMSPGERKTQGAAINQAKDEVTQALAATRLWPLAVVWTVGIIVAAIPMGGHYVVDLIGGCAIWLAAAAIARRAVASSPSV